MNSTFIPLTNNKYSIDKKGIVYSHKSTVSIIKPNDNKVRILINNKSTSRSIRRLLLEVFNIFNCIHCDKTCNNYNDRFICYTCRRKQSKKSVNNHYKNHNELVKSKSKRNRDNLTNAYINQILGTKISDNIPKEILNAKRNQLLLTRQLYTNDTNKRTHDNNEQIKLSIS